MDRLKIMTAMYTLKRGGSYDRFQMMIESFLERGGEVHCLSLSPIGIEHANYHNHLIWLPFQIGKGRMAKWVALLLFPLHGLWIGWKQKISLFIAFGPVYAFIQGIPKWVLRRPLVTMIRGNPSFGLQAQGSPKFMTRGSIPMERLALRLSDFIITNNRANREEIIRRIGIKREVRIAVLFNDIPFIPPCSPEEILKKRSQLGFSKNTKALITAGILNRGKNMEMLIRCLSRIGMDHLYLVIAGDGSTEADLRYKEELRDLAETSGLGGRVIFTGWLKKEDLWKTLSAADLFVMPSLSEGMPNALLEALGLGLPCLGSKVPGISDVLEHDELLFDPMDEDALAQKIREIFSDLEYYRKIIELCQGRKKLFMFDWKERLFEMTVKRALSPQKKSDRGTIGTPF